MGRGSDASLVVPHVDVVQGWNPLLPWTILFGSSISVWGTSGVAIGCDNPIFGETTCEVPSVSASLNDTRLLLADTYGSHWA